MQLKYNRIYHISVNDVEVKIGRGKGVGRRGQNGKTAEDEDTLIIICAIIIKTNATSKPKSPIHQMVKANESAREKK